MSVGTLLERIPAGRNRGLALVTGGMGALLFGRKVVGLGLFAKGVMDLEDAWRRAHPGFRGDLEARWKEAVSFYESTHTDPTNRMLHTAGIPLILGGAIGLVAMPSYSPPWWASAGAFGTGWALNVVGHAVFERNRPAFADDPLSFLAGPAWDLKRLMERVGGRAGAATSA